MSPETLKPEEITRRQFLDRLAKGLCLGGLACQAGAKFLPENIFLEQRGPEIDQGNGSGQNQNSNSLPDHIKVRSQEVARPEFSDLYADMVARGGYGVGRYLVGEENRMVILEGKSGGIVIMPDAPLIYYHPEISEVFSGHTFLLIKTESEVVALKPSGSSSNARVVFRNSEAERLASCGVFGSKSFVLIDSVEGESMRQRQPSMAGMDQSVAVGLPPEPNNRILRVFDSSGILVHQIEVSGGLQLIEPYQSNCLGLYSKDDGVIQIFYDDGRRVSLGLPKENSPALVPLAIISNKIICMFLQDGDPVYLEIDLKTNSMTRTEEEPDMTKILPKQKYWVAADSGNKSVVVKSSGTGEEVTLSLPFVPVFSGIIEVSQRNLAIFVLGKDRIIRLIPVTELSPEDLKKIKDGDQRKLEETKIIASLMLVMQQYNEQYGVKKVSLEEYLDRLKKLNPDFEKYVPDLPGEELKKLVDPEHPMLKVVINGKLVIIQSSD